MPLTPRLRAYLDSRRRLVEGALRRRLSGPSAGPTGLRRAMRYSALAGGKRLRPVLALAAAEACGARAADALPVACAVELIHTYSLVHDDLPAMDDDDLRRGRPTNHKVFGEAAAILAGDGLLTYAFELAAEAGGRRGRAAEAIAALARGAGPAGMVGGQLLDLEAEKASRKGAAARLSRVHELKTASLLCAALEAGALCAGADARRLKALRAYGRAFGLAFQIADDVLDLVGDKALMGKNGSDQRNGKLTYPALYGVEASRRKARALARSAQAALAPFGGKAWMLAELADYAVERDR